MTGSVLKTEVFWDVTQCCWASSSWHTGGLQGLYLKGQAVKEEDEGITVLWNINGSVTSQMTWIFSNTAVRVSNLTGHLC